MTVKTAEPTTSIPRGRRPSPAGAPDLRLASLSTFADALPSTEDPHDLGLRRQLFSRDGRLRREAALQLGASYLRAAPDVAMRLLQDAAEGEPLTAGHALLRLARYEYTRDDTRKTQARELLERARDITSAGAARADDLDLLALRMEIGAAFALINCPNIAIEILQPLELTLLPRESSAKRLDVPPDPKTRELAARVTLRLGESLSAHNPAGGAAVLRRALALGSGWVAAHAALELGNLLRDKLNGFGAEIEELYRTAADLDDPLASPAALVALGDLLWMRGPKVEGRRAWDRASECGDDMTLERISRRRSGEWQRAQLQEAAERIGRPDRPGAPPAPAQHTAASAQPGSAAPVRTFAGSAAVALRRVIVIGAGTGGHYLLPELSLERGWKVTAFVDDDPQQVNVDDVPVAGTIAELPRIVARYSAAGEHIDQIIFAIPTASGSVRDRAWRAARDCGVRLVALPSMFELRRSYPLLPQLRELRVHETYGERPWTVDREASGLVHRRGVLITGAGTTLGAEVARRVAHGGPSHLLLVDEPAADSMRIFNEIRERREFVDCGVRIADCAATIELDEIFDEFRPDIVFHCGGLMHECPGAIQPTHVARANVLTAYRVGTAAREHGAADFVLASSEHAAQRSNAFDMGQALGESAVLSLKRTGRRGFRVSVLRIPKIWADAGTVVERFEDQLRSGGPLYVNPVAQSRCVQRWEAAQALLRLVDRGHDGGIFALTVGDDVDIAELAQRIIRMNGLADAVEIVYDPATTDKDAELTMWGDEEHRGSALYADVLEVRQDDRLEARLLGRVKRLLRAFRVDSPDRDAIHRALRAGSHPHLDETKPTLLIA